MTRTHFPRIMKFLQPWSDQQSHQFAIIKSVINLVLLVLWAWLYWPVFQYLAVLFTREEFRTNQIVLLVVAGLLVYRARRLGLRFEPDAKPRLFWPGLALASGSSTAYLLVERYLDINTLSAVLFGLASYGLLGLWLSSSRWKRGIPAMLLLIGVLPFGEHLETFAGYPLRTFTAGLVRDALSGLGYHSVGVDTILVFESGISQVDIPCSGVKSLWTGALFLLAATWIENRQIGLRWLMVGLATGLLLFSSNLVRVAVLALVGPGLGWMLLARMLHIPLGVLGFLAVCAVTLYLLKRVPETPQALPSVEAAQSIGRNEKPVWLAPVVVFCVLVMALAYSPRAANQQVLAGGPPVWRFPAELTVQPAPLSPREQEWIRQGGAETADRLSFQWLSPEQPVTGTLMFLTSQSWRGQHNPERCFEVFGLTVKESYTYLVSAEFSLRYLSLAYGEAPDRLSAAYWLQSKDQTTEDFGKRIWADLSPNRERWVLVTVLFDRLRLPQSADLAQFFTAIHASVNRSLNEGVVP
jgi:exosortase O